MPPSKRPPAPPSPTRVALLILLLVAGAAASVWVLQKLATLVFVLTLAALVAYVLAPIVERVQRPIRLGGRRRRLPRSAAIVLVYLFTAGAVSAGAVLVLPNAIRQADELIARAPTFARSAVTWEQGWSGSYERLRIPPELRAGADRSLQAAGASMLESARESAVAFLSGLVADLPWLALVPILAFLFLIDAAAFERAILAALPPSARLGGRRLLDDLNATLAAFVRAQLLACLLVGSVCGIGFAVIGVPYAVVLGMLAGMLEFIPLVGPLLLAIGAATVAAFHAPILAFWTIGFLGVLRIAEDYVVYPRLMGRGMPLPPLAVIVAVLAGAEVGGIPGMFLAVPVLAIAWVVSRHALRWRRGRRVVEPGAA